MSTKINKLVKMSMLFALSIVLMMLIRFPIIPSAPFLEYEPADIPIIVGTFLYGPLSGLLLTIAVSFIQATCISTTGWVGFIMHVLSTGGLVLVSGFIYKKKPCFLSSIVALILGCTCMILIMIPSNLFFTVKCFGVPYDVVKTLIPTAIIPFNMVKSAINSIGSLIIYNALGHAFSDVKLKKQKING
jgi:riboflavin transporter